MTLEDAVYYRRMLSFGLGDVYEQDFSVILEQEEPLKPLTLELAFCLSDVNQTISVLDHYVGERKYNTDMVYQKLMREMSRRYLEGALTPEQIAEKLFSVMAGFEDGILFAAPWHELVGAYYDYDEGYFNLRETAKEVIEVISKYKE